MVEKKNSVSIVTCLIFSFILLFGILSFKDYGMTFDEQLQRHHSLVNYSAYVKIVDQLFCTNVYDQMRNLDEYSISIKYGIDRYPYKYYGVGIQYPLVFIEQLFHFKLDFMYVFYIRHLYTFLFYFLSLIYLYKLLKNYIFRKNQYKDYLSLLGVIFMFLSPRILGDSFYNIKDLMFLSLSIINTYYCFKYLENDGIKNTIILSIVTAFMINSRVIGGIIIFFLFLFKFIQDKNKKKSIVRLSIVFFLTFLVYYIITPVMWKNILSYPIELFKFFFNYKDPVTNTLQSVYYFGKKISSISLPWHYLLVWIFITTPIVTFILFVIGIVKVLCTKKQLINKYLVFVNTIFIFVIMFYIIFRPTIYGGWRHFYFIYYIMIIDAVVGVDLLLRKYNKKWITVFLFISLVPVGVWMIKNHPYEMEYFSTPFKKQISSNFERNYWNVSNVDALQKIVSIDKGKIIVESTYNKNIDYLLTKKQRTNVTIVQNKPSIADYIIDTHIYGNLEYEKTMEVIQIKKIDGVRLYTIYKRKNV